MPRAPSITLRLARVLNANLERIEAKLIREPEKLLSKTEAETLLICAKADAILRGRNPEEGETEEMTGKASETDAAALVERMRKHLKDPAASSADGDPEKEP